MPARSSRPRRGARPDRDDRRAELGRDVDGSAEQLHPPLPALGDERREVLAAPVEQERRSGLHHGRQLQVFEPCAQPPCAAESLGASGSKRTWPSVRATPSYPFSASSSSASSIGWCTRPFET